MNNKWKIVIINLIKRIRTIITTEIKKFEYDCIKWDERINTLVSDNVQNTHNKLDDTI